MSAATSTPRAVRLPQTLDDAVMAACGGQENFAEWARNVFRRQVGFKLNYDAGYAEGKAKGWSDASREFKAAMAKTSREL